MNAKPMELIKQLLRYKEGKVAVGMIAFGVIGAILIAVFFRTAKFLILYEIVLTLVVFIGTNRFSRIIYFLNQENSNKK